MIFGTVLGLFNGCKLSKIKCVVLNVEMCG